MILRCDRCKGTLAIRRYRKSYKHLCKLVHLQAYKRSLEEKAEPVTCAQVNGINVSHGGE